MLEKPKTVDMYILQAPKDLQDRLRDICRAIKSAAPHAVEKISYSMPYYHYKGRLAYFSLNKKHIGLYVPPPTIAQFKKELTGYVTAKATVQFPHDKKLPLGLIKRIVVARRKYNDLKF